MKLSRTTVPALLLAALLAFAPGCGGGDDSDPQAAKTETARTEPATTAPDAEKDKAKERPKRTEKPAPDDAAGEAPDEAAPSGAPARMSRAEFVKRADGICRENQAKLAKATLNNVKPGKGGAPAANPYSGKPARILRDTADQIAALPRPGSGPSPDGFVEAQREFATLLAEVGEAFKEITPEGGTLGESDQARMRAISTRLQRVTRRLVSLGRAQGFKVCGLAGI